MSLFKKKDRIPTPPKEVEMPKPRIVERGIVPPTLFDKMMGKGFHDVKEPFVFLIKENLEMITIENVKKGFLEMGDEQRKKRIELTPSKMLSWKTANGYKKGWVAFENEMQPYPHNPKHDGETFYKIIQKLTMNYRDFEEKAQKAKITMILMLVAGAVVIIWFVANSGLIDKLKGG